MPGMEDEITIWESGTKKSETKKTSILYWNIRSMKKHFKSFNFKFSVICLSETWFQISDSNFQWPGYYRFHISREKSRREELCIFLQETYSYKFSKDLQVNFKAFEY